MTSTLQRWHWRGLTSLLTLAGFLVMSITGIVLYLVPEGRIAYWTDWTLMGLTKTHWGDIHILSSLLFVVAGAFHTYFNWKPLVAYLRNKAGGGVRLKKELAVSVGAMVLVTLSAVLGLPPLSYLLDLNGVVKSAWASKEHEPPFGHAELLSLEVFCSKTDLPLQPVIDELNKNHLDGVDPSRPLKDIAKDNGMSPLDVYRLIKQFEIPPDAAPRGEITAKYVEEAFGGTGMGNKSIADVATRLHLEVGVLHGRLVEKGIEGSETESLKAIATRNGLQPLDVVKAAVLDDFKPAASR